MKRESACVGVIGFGEVGSRMLWKVWTEGLRNPLSLCVFWDLERREKGGRFVGLSCLVTFVGEILGVREG